MAVFPLQVETPREHSLIVHPLAQRLHAHEPMSVVLAYILPIAASSGPQDRCLQNRLHIPAPEQRVEFERDPVRRVLETAVEFSVRATAHPLDIAVKRISVDDAMPVNPLQERVFVLVCSEVPIGLGSHGRRLTRERDAGTSTLTTGQKSWE